MPKQFTLTEQEVICNETIGKDQVDLINRMVIFVNERLAEIESIQIDVEKSKQDIINLKPKSK